MEERDGPFRIGRLESSRALRARARELRRAATPSEERLWQALRDRRFRGLKFRRQRPAGSFIADFFCAELGLVVEVDGGVHDQPEVRQRDALRDEWLGSRRLRVLRLSAGLVMDDLAAALGEIGAAVDAIRGERPRGEDSAFTSERPSPPAPLPPERARGARTHRELQREGGTDGPW